MSVAKRDTISIAHIRCPLVTFGNCGTVVGICCPLATLAAVLKTDIAQKSKYNLVWRGGAGGQFQQASLPWQGATKSAKKWRDLQLWCQTADQAQMLLIPYTHTATIYNQIVWVWGRRTEWHNALDEVFLLIQCAFGCGQNQYIAGNLCRSYRHNSCILWSLEP